MRWAVAAGLALVCSAALGQSSISTPVDLKKIGGNTITTTVPVSGTVSTTAAAATEDANNTSTTTLAAFTAFTGTATNVTGIGTIVVSAFADQSCAGDGLEIQFGPDGTNWDHEWNSTLNSCNSAQYSTAPFGKFFRVRYNNGATPQGAFRLKTLLYPSVTTPGSISIRDGKSPGNTVEVVSTSPSGGERGLVVYNIPATGFTQIVTSPTATALKAEVVGNATNNTGTSGSDNVKVLPGVVSTSPPTHTNTRPVALSMQTDGSARMAVTNTVATSISSTVTVKSNQTNGNSVSNESLNVIPYRVNTDPTDPTLAGGTNDQGYLTTNGWLRTTSEGTIDGNNVTSTPLGGAATYNGTDTDVRRYKTIAIYVYADVASSTPGLKCQFSNTGASYDVEVTANIAANTGYTLICPVLGPHFRAQYINGAGAQSVFRLQTALHAAPLGEAALAIVGSDTPQTLKAIGVQDSSSQVRAPRSYDTDSGAGSQHTIGVSLRKTASGGSVEAGTTADPLVVNGKITDGTATDQADVEAANLASGVLEGLVVRPYPPGDGTNTATVRDTGTSDSLNVAIVDGAGAQITSFGGGTQYDEDTISAAADKLTMAGVVRKDTAATLVDTDGDRSQLQVDAVGRLHVNGSGVTQPVSGTVTANAGTGDFLTVTGHTRNEAFKESDAVGGELDDTAPVAATEGNVSPMRITAQRALHTNLRNDSGTEIGTAGAPVRVDPTGTTTQPVSITSGNFPDNEPFNLNQVAGAAVATGNGTAAGSIRVSLASDSTGSTAVTQATAANLNAEVQGDAAHAATVSGNPVQIGAYVEADAAALDSTGVVEGEITRIKADIEGRQLVSTAHPNRFHASSGLSTATTLTQIQAAPGAGVSLYITDFVMSSTVASTATADQSLTLKYGQGVNCATTTVFITACIGPANGGCTAHLQTPIKLPANNALCWIHAAAGTKVISVTGFTAP